MMNLFSVEIAEVVGNGSLTFQNVALGIYMKDKVFLCSHQKSLFVV